MKKILLLLLTAATAALPAAGEPAGCLYVPETSNSPAIILPLKKTDVSMKVTAGIARTEVVQRFHNDLDQPLEAVYIFPLPSGAAVTGFEIRLKDRVIRSEVRERIEAQEAYEQAKAEGKKAALLEEERPNLFTTSVANLLPGETADICLTYSETLSFRTGCYDITFPMVTGERYIPFKPGPDGTRITPVKDHDRLNPPVLPPTVDPEHRLSLDIRIQGLPVDYITSNTHAIEVQTQGGGQFLVSLAGQETVADSAFSIAVHLKKNDTPAVSFVKSSAHGEAFGLLSVFPPVGRTNAPKALPKDVIFLIDTSGSMSGDSISQAKSGLKRCLAILNPQDRFTIIRFASEFSWFSPDLRDVTPERLEAARDYIAGLSADNGTEMQPALDYALSLPKSEGRLPMIIFLTDGDVGNEDSLSALLMNKIGNTRLFTFGIGSAPNEFLMHRMAEIGRGQSRFIRSHEDVGEVMADFFQTLDNPVLTDVSVHWDDPAVQCYPERCPDIFYGRPLQLIARSAGPFSGQVRVSGTLDGQTTDFTVDLGQLECAEHPALNQLFGQMEIKEQMIRMLQVETPEQKQALKQNIIQTALKYQLVSAYTSRVAIEERVTVENGSPVTVKVPVPAPRGWTLYAGATADPLRVLAGLAALAAAGLGWRLRRAVRT